MSGVAPPTPYQWSVGDVANAALLDAQLYTGLTFLLGPPVAFYLQSSAQSLANSAFNSITWPTPSVDTYGGYAGANPTRYTPTQAGYYFAVGQIGWAPNATGGRTAYLLKNGATAIGQTSAGNSTSSFNSVLPAVGGAFFNGSSDYFELQSDQNSGVPLNSVPAFTSLLVWMFHT